MADTEPQNTVESTPVEDVEMGGSADADAGAGTGANTGEEAALTELEPDAPKLVLFSE